MKVEAVCAGISDDRRTNVWRVTCVCGRQFSPTTTMFRHQHFACPKCGQEYAADWNQGTVEAAA